MVYVLHDDPVAAGRRRARDLDGKTVILHPTHTDQRDARLRRTSSLPDHHVRRDARHLRQRGRPRAAAPPGQDDPGPQPLAHDGARASAWAARTASARRSTAGTTRPTRWTACRAGPSLPEIADRLGKPMHVQEPRGRSWPSSPEQRRLLRRHARGDVAPRRRPRIRRTASPPLAQRPQTDVMRAKRPREPSRSTVAASLPPRMTPALPAAPSSEPLIRMDTARRDLGGRRPPARHLPRHQLLLVTASLLVYAEREGVRRSSRSGRARTASARAGCSSRSRTCSS